MENGDRKSETKRYNSKKVKIKSKKEKVTKKKSKAFKVIKILILVLFLTCIIAGGVGVGVFWTTYKDELKIEKDELVIKAENSTVYDSNNEFLAELSGGTKRKIISLGEMGEYLPKAYIAIEDERFREHSGVDLKRTAAATFTFITHAGKSSFGGSTITQQLVKNITNDKEDSKIAGVIRKVKEMAKAYQVEQYLSKDQILELYLNLIFMGGNDINGVYLGGIYYFNKEPADLSIAECAFLAGINNSPNSYDAFSSDEKKVNLIKKRTKTVLKKMKELNYISQEQYDEAVTEVDNGLKFEKGEDGVTTEVSYVVEAALNQILDQLMEEKEMSKKFAETYLYSGGLKIYTTQDTSIQSVLEETLSKDVYYTEGMYIDKKTKEKVYEDSMPTMVIMDHSTGRVVASASAIGKKGERVTTTRIGYLNVPTRLRKSTGSSMKPISVIAPGLESETITAATVYNDAKTTFGKTYTPKNYYQGYKGNMTIRHAIGISANVPHVKALSNIGLETSIAFCESIGLPKFDKEGLSLALGGLTDGVTTTEMAGAYSAIANDGKYIQPTFYTKVTDGEGNVVLEPKQEENQVMSVENAYIEKDILTEPIKGPGATAPYCAIKGMSTAAKTGTTNEDFDRWLCGFTPYYTAVCWYGYKTNAAVDYSGNPAGKIWAEVMKAIHKDLPNAEFVRPDDVKTVTICSLSGKKATEGCTETYTEVFTEKTIPTDCPGHQMYMICQETGLLCAEGCPHGAWNTFGDVPDTEIGAVWEPNGGDGVKNVVPTEYCPHHTPTPTVPEFTVIANLVNEVSENTVTPQTKPEFEVVNTTPSNPEPPKPITNTVPTNTVVTPPATNTVTPETPATNTVTPPEPPTIDTTGDE